MKQNQQSSHKQKERQKQQMQNNYTIYNGLLSKKINIKQIKNTKIIWPEQIFVQKNLDTKCNTLKYRFPLTYLGKQYENVVVPCTPAYQLSIGNFIRKDYLMSMQLQCFVKVPEETGVSGLASGKRSAIFINNQGKLLRFKGCGNGDQGFNRQNNESRGHHFFQTVKRQLYMTNKINKLMKQNLQIFPPANIPLYAFDYPPQQIKNLNLINDLPLINKYCAVFETQGDRRAGTHLISPLQIIYLTIVQHDKVNWNAILKAKDRVDENGNIVQIVSNMFDDFEGVNKFIDKYNSTPEINNYLQLQDVKLTVMQNYNILVQQLIQKYVPEQYREITIKLINGISREQIIALIEILVQKIGYEMGQVIRVMYQNEISWGFYLDHGIQWHCNAHLNNFIVTKPRVSKQSNNFFLLPLDYDLAYQFDQFICIDVDGENYGENCYQVFERYLCGQFMAMEMSLFGLELMNFKYGIEQKELEKSEIKISRIYFRDCLVSAFNNGMRNKINIKQKIKQYWDKNIQGINKLVEICLYLSMEFQT